MSDFKERLTKIIGKERIKELENEVKEEVKQIKLQKKKNIKIHLPRPDKR
jgi:hypothetical protein